MDNPNLAFPKIWPWTTCLRITCGLNKDSRMKTRTQKTALWMSTPSESSAHTLESTLSDPGDTEEIGMPNTGPHPPPSREELSVYSPDLDARNTWHAQVELYAKLCKDFIVNIKKIKAYYIGKRVTYQKLPLDLRPRIFKIQLFLYNLFSKYLLILNETQSLTPPLVFTRWTHSDPEGNPG